MYTLDANSFVGDASLSDPDHAVCHALIARLSQSGTTMVVPLLVLTEVAGALSRSYRDPLRARLEIELLRELHTIRFVPLDDVLAQEAEEQRLPSRGWGHICFSVVANEGSDHTANASSWLATYPYATNSNTGAWITVVGAVRERRIS